MSEVTTQVSEEVKREDSERIVGIVPVELKKRIEGYCLDNGTTFCHVIRKCLTKFAEDEGL